MCIVSQLPVLGKCKIRRPKSIMEGYKNMKVIRKRPGEGPKVIDVRSIEQIYAEIGKNVKRVDIATNAAILYDDGWRENGKHMNTVLCGLELGGTVFIVGCSENDLTDLPNVDGALYAFFVTVRYMPIDKANNVWQCRHCDYIQQFEADGPYENGWNVCPSCGGLLLTPKLQEVAK